MDTGEPRDYARSRSEPRRREGDAISRLADVTANAQKVGQVARARLALRRCDQLGALTRLEGRVVLRNSGVVRIGSRVRFRAHPTPIELSTLSGGEIVIGDGTFLNRGVCICARLAIHIGRNCALGNDVLILDSDFHRIGHHDEFGSDTPAAVVIGNDVWLAARSVVLKGVTIGDGAVVCAGAVVVSSVPPYTMVGGVPARPIRRLTAAEGAPPAPTAGAAPAAATGWGAGPASRPAHGAASPSPPPAAAGPATRER
jgi:acetyltransferase-like isoleucine patch superfamily enzyme